MVLLSILYCYCARTY